MADTSTCAHGVSLSSPCAGCDQVCKELDATVTR